MLKSDFHLHTVYCDGVNTPSQLAQAAFEKGFTAIGFSGHSYTPFDTSYCMKPAQTELYFREIHALKAAYAGRLQVFCGVEQDLYAPPPEYSYDYIIGSVHYLPLDGGYYAVDESLEQTAMLLHRFFHDDWDALCEYYFEQVAQLADTVQPDIIGHLDLVNKFSPSNAVTPRFMAAAKKAVDALLQHEVSFELNTGAMARGFKTDPYPCRELLQYLSAHGARLILSSDSHRAQTLGYAFEEARRLAESCGFEDGQILAYPLRLSSPSGHNSPTE